MMIFGLSVLAKIILISEPSFAVYLNLTKFQVYINDSGPIMKKIVQILETDDLEASIIIKLFEVVFELMNKGSIV